MKLAIAFLLAAASALQAFPPDLFLTHGLVGSAASARRPVPIAPVGHSPKCKTRSPERGPWLRVQDRRLDVGKPHQFADGGACRIELGAGVLRAVSSQPVDFNHRVLWTPIDQRAPTTGAWCR